MGTRDARLDVEAVGALAEFRGSESSLSERTMGGWVHALFLALHEDPLQGFSEGAMECMERVWWGIYHVARRRLELAGLAELAMARACDGGNLGLATTAGRVLGKADEEAKLACDRRDCCAYIIDAAGCEVNQSGQVVGQPMPGYHRLGQHQGEDEPVGVLRGRLVNEYWKQGAMRISQERWGGVTMRGGPFEAWEVVRMGYRDTSRDMGDDPMDCEK